MEGAPPTWDTLAAEFGLTVNKARYAFQKGVSIFREVLSMEMGEEGEEEFNEALAELFGIVKGGE
jgi:hypothetical protein